MPVSARLMKLTIMHDVQHRGSGARSAGTGVSGCVASPPARLRLPVGPCAPVRICASRARGSHSSVCSAAERERPDEQRRSSPRRSRTATGTSPDRGASRASGSRRSAASRPDGTSGRSRRRSGGSGASCGFDDLQDVVRAVAVVALGGLRVAELRHLAVVRVEVGLGDLLVAAAALGHDRQLEALLVRPADRVRAVAVVARRELLACCC